MAIWNMKPNLGIWWTGEEGGLAVKSPPPSALVGASGVGLSDSAVSHDNQDGSRPPSRLSRYIAGFSLACANTFANLPFDLKQCDICRTYHRAMSVDLLLQSNACRIGRIVPTLVINLRVDDNLPGLERLNWPMRRWGAGLR